MLDAYWVLLDSAGYVLSFVRFSWIPTEFCWILLVSYWVLLDYAWFIPSFVGLCWIHTGFCWIMLDSYWVLLDSAGCELSFVGFCWIRTEFCWILPDVYWVLLDSAASFFSIWASSWRHVSKLRNMIHTVDRKWDVTKRQCAMRASCVINRVGYEILKERVMNSVSEVSVRNIHVGTHVC